MTLPPTPVLATLAAILVLLVIATVASVMVARRRPAGGAHGKEYFSLIPTHRVDRRVLFWAYLASPSRTCG